MYRVTSTDPTQGTYECASAEEADSAAVTMANGIAALRAGSRGYVRVERDADDTLRYVAYARSTSAMCGPRVIATITIA
jgi:hypothetical protein